MLPSGSSLTIFTEGTQTLKQDGSYDFPTSQNVGCNLQGSGGKTHSAACPQAKPFEDPILLDHSPPPPPQCPGHTLTQPQQGYCAGLTLPCSELPYPYTLLFSYPYPYSFFVS